MAARLDPIEGRKIRFGLVGCGRISANHIEAIQKHSDQAELVAVCDTDPAALEATVQKTRARGYSRLSDLLADASVDVVSLCTPSGLHPEQARQSAQAGKHVVSEKPMATSWEDGLAMVREVEDQGVRLFVVKQNRRNSTLQLLKKALDQGRFGKIYNVALNVFWTRPQSYYDQAPWRGTWKWDGGAFMNQASHYVDLLTWLLGPLDELHAFTATHARKIEAEDSGVVSLKWKSGALGTLNVTMLTYPKNLEGSITILGEKGTVRVGGVAVNEIQVWDFDEARAEDAGIREASYATTSVYGHGHPLYYQNVIETLQGKADPETDGNAGLQSLQTLIGIYRSAREGKRVALPLERT